MRKLLSVLLVLSVLLTGCTFVDTAQTNISSESTSISSSEITYSTTVETTTETESISTDSSTVAQPSSSRVDDYLDKQARNMNFRSMSDPKLLDFMEGVLYSHLVDDLGKNICIDNVRAIYLSQEYIDELTYNSKENVFFGYTLKELDSQFQGQTYSFTVENGETVVKARAPYDDTYDKMIRNVAIGTGVILICVTITIVTYGAGASAACAIFAAAAEGGAIGGLSGALGGAVTGVLTGVQTGDWEKAKKEGALAASEGYKFGAITGAIISGVGEAAGLYDVSRVTKLSMDQVAVIQRESKLPLSLIKEFKTFEQYEIIRDSGLYGKVINGQQAIVRDIDLEYVKDGMTNLQRMQKGLAPLDPTTDLPYELHHMGQTQDATIAILTQEEHRGAGRHAIWHDLISESQVDHGNVWTTQKRAFWKAFALLFTQ